MRITQRGKTNLIGAGRKSLKCLFDWKLTKFFSDSVFQLINHIKVNSISKDLSLASAVVER